MKGAYLQKAMMKSGGFLKRNAPTILSCLGAAGVVSTSIFTAKATTKASALIEQATLEKGEKLEPLEVINVALPVYIPAILSGVATVACIFGANTLNKNHQASLIAAYGMLDQSYKEYKAKVEELHGPRH